VEALRILREFSLHRAGITYEQQGFVNGDGQLWAWKIDEHLLVAGFYDEAYRTKYGH
jgi:hypothetical protein